MYAQRGSGKRSSFYSDYTFGVWWKQGPDGDALVPVGKAYFGFTDEELLRIDRFVRRNTTESFGPVRHVLHEPDQGWCWKSPLRGCSVRPGTNQGWRCVFRGSTDCAGTSRRARRIGWRRWSGCWPPKPPDPTAIDGRTVVPHLPHTDYVAQVLVPAGEL